MTRLLLPALLLLLPGPVLAARWSEPEITGVVTDRAIAEISGLAAARNFPGHYWAINDSGDDAVLHLVDGRGRHVGSVPVRGARNRDWEDLASFERDGRRWLLIADVGDNGGLRKELQLIVMEEPTTLGEPADPAWIQAFRWPDGPRDCEAVAVDAVAGEVLLVSKKRVPAELFRLPLGAHPGGQSAVAELVGTLPGIEQPDARDLELNPVYGRYRAQVTAADLSPNGRVLAVLNYRSVHFYIRERGGDWAPALAPDARHQHLLLPWLPQAEGLAFGADGREIVIGSEQLPSPFLRYRMVPGS
ncbi:hypothetical protein [Arenimonas caeni]|jgi:hypothetical protein|uniref:hypothetical protein n=1 Tax=Arenimonas caeni TaxID=2058085 RepID=UPI002A369DD6|nr:hypothetical protein [Arenimonas caeni]MDY0022796.1 hypothetical protein [Arenimonas caeni]